MQETGAEAVAATRSRVRPADRKAQIVAIAREQFCRRSFHNVTIGTITDRVGITSSAFYKHFPDKLAILHQIIVEDLDAIERALAHPQGRGQDLIEWLSATLIDHALDRRGSGLLLQREIRALRAPTRAQFRARARRVLDTACEIVFTARGDLTREQCLLLTCCAFGLAMGPSYHRVQLPPDRFKALLRAMIAPTLSASPATSIRTMSRAQDEPAPVPRLLVSRASRREALLGASIRMFARSGYPSVSMIEIGAAVGITGPSIYSHFASKGDMLMAGIVRASEGLQMSLEAALSEAQSVDDALRKMAEAYIDFAFRHNCTLETLIGEIQHLPELEQRRARDLQREYVGEWTQVLSEKFPKLAPNEIRAATLSFLAMLNDCARSMRFLNSQDLRRTLAELSIEVLGNLDTAAPAKRSP